MRYSLRQINQVSKMDLANSYLKLLAIFYLLTWNRGSSDGNKMVNEERYVDRQELREL